MAERFLASAESIRSCTTTTTKDEASRRQQQRRRLRVLTVGDGDLSLSLSLARCFGSHYLDLTATTLLASAEILCATYPATAESHLQELRQVHAVPVLFGVNACFLHTHPALLEKPWDVISFHHPHLGMADSHHLDDTTTTTCELDLVQRHTSLLAHYLHSAAQMLTTTTTTTSSQDAPPAIVHVALCMNQAESWKLRQTAEHLGLELVRDQGFPVQRPFYQIFPKLFTTTSDDVFPWDLDPHWQPPPPPPPQQQSPTTSTTTTTTTITKQRRSISKRHGGSRHWLGKFGYRHVRTVPTTMNPGTTAPNLTGSRHYTLRKRQVVPPKALPSSSTPVEATVRLWECPICKVSYATRSELQEHRNDPASPKLFHNTALPIDRTTNDKASVGPAAVMVSWSDGTKTSTTSTEGFQLVKIVESNPDDCDSDNATKNNTVTVVLQTTKAIAGKRLRWCLQHLLQYESGLANKVQHQQLPRCIQSFSNSDWNRFIKQGGVFVNGVLAIDTGRILQEGWTIELKLRLASKSPNVDPTVISNQDYCGANTNNAAPLLHVIEKWNPLNGAGNTIFVVWKPVGMRVIGSFDTGTLEETFSRQQRHQQSANCKNNGQDPLVAAKYTSFSRLDTGCSGLCVLAPTGVWKEDDVEMVQTFTALVHGHVPDEWTNGVTVTLDVDTVRRWKKQAETIAEPDAATQPRKQPKTCCTALFLCTERTTTSPTHDESPVIPALSTIAISIHCRSSRLASVVASYLRTVAHHPVVGDRLAADEYLALPRAMRNRTKHRFCLGCTRVELNIIVQSTKQQQQQQQQQQEQRTIEHPIPEKWRARYWQEFCTSGTTGKVA